MPPYSSIRTFIEALRTRQTNITRALETVANDRHILRKHETDIRDPQAFHPQFPRWARAQLRERMSLDELVHIEGWPREEKEVVRRQLEAVLDGERRLIFRWELFDGDAPRTEVRSERDDEATIVFQSPREGVEVTSVLNLGDIRVRQ